MRILSVIAALFCLSSAASAADMTEKAGGGTYERHDMSGPYIGVGAGYQITDYAISIGGQDFSGIAQDGFTATAHVGWNLLVSPDFYLAPELEVGISDASVEFGPLGDVIELDNFASLTIAGKYFIAPQTWVGPRAGYELQYLTALGNTDVETGWWLLGAELGTEAAQGVSLKLTADILFLDFVEVDGLTGPDNDTITEALEDSITLRIQARTSYRMPTPQSLRKVLGD